MYRTPAGNFCTVGHALAYTVNKRENAAEKKRKADRKVLKAKVDGSDPKKQKALTQAAFNKMRRLEELLWFHERGLDPTCISCGQPLGGDVWCCGHLKSRGASSGLRFDPMNTFLQHNRRCNMALSGDIEGTKTTMGYKAGLLERFGQEEGQAIIDYCESHDKVREWKCDELMEIRKGFNKRIRELLPMLR